jgi:hypothetical protein
LTTTRCRFYYFFGQIFVLFWQKVFIPKLHEKNLWQWITKLLV